MPPHQASKSSKKKKQKKNRQHEVGCGSVMSSKNSGNRFPIVKKKKNCQISAVSSVWQIGHDSSQNSWNPLLPVVKKKLVKQQ